MGEASDPKSSHVEVAIGRTLGLPNFNTFRVDVSVRIPCADAPEARDAAFQEGKAFCFDRVRVEIDAVKEKIRAMQRRGNGDD